MHRNVRAAFPSQEICRLQTHCLLSCLCWCHWRQAADGNLAAEEEAKGGTNLQTNPLHQFDRKNKSDLRITLSFCFYVLDMNVLIVRKSALERRGFLGLRRSFS